MCGYSYQAQNEKIKEKSCYLASFFKENKLFKTKNELPVDTAGFCVFHSTDKGFKQKNNFEELLNKFIQFSNEAPEVNIIDLRGMVLSGELELKLENLIITKELDLSKARCISPLRVVKSVFKDNVFLDYIIATNKVFFIDTDFYGDFTMFGGVVFNKEITFRNVKFHEIFDIDSANFMNKANFSDVSFLGRTSFDKVSFRGEASSVYFKVKIEGITEFNETVFSGPVEFENCVFKEDTSFVGTKFQDPILISNPQILNTIFFKGIDEHNKVFSTGVELKIDDDSFDGAGQIIFENVNLMYLDGDVKTKLAYYQKNRRIVLGEGTEVFMFSFQESYPYSALDELFITDILAKIKQYFDYNLNKHFEFVLTKKGDDLIVTFYTDYYAREKDFKSEQFESVKKLLSGEYKDDKMNNFIAKQLLQLLSEGIKELKEGNINPEVFLQILSEKNLNLFVGGSHQFADEINNYKGMRIGEYKPR